MKDKKEEIILKLKKEIKNLWSKEDLSNELMAKIQKKAHDLLGDTQKKGELSKSEVLEVALKG